MSANIEMHGKKSRISIPQKRALEKARQRRNDAREDDELEEGMKDVLPVPKEKRNEPVSATNKGKWSSIKNYILNKRPNLHLNKVSREADIAKHPSQSVSGASKHRLSTSFVRPSMKKYGESGGNSRISKSGLATYKPHSDYFSTFLIYLNRFNLYINIYLASPPGAPYNPPAANIPYQKPSICSTLPKINPQSSSQNRDALQDPPVMKAGLVSRIKTGRSHSLTRFNSVIKKNVEQLPHCRVNTLVPMINFDGYLQATDKKKKLPNSSEFRELPGGKNDGTNTIRPIIISECQSERNNEVCLELTCPFKHRCDSDLATNEDIKDMFNHVCNSDSDDDLPSGSTLNAILREALTKRTSASKTLRDIRQYFRVLDAPESINEIKNCPTDSDVTEYQ